MSNNHQQESYPHKILRYATTHLNRYHAYQMTLIQIQVHWIILCRTHLTHLTPVILNGNRCNNEPIKQCAKLIYKLLKAASNYNITKSKLDADLLQRWVYLLNFMNSLKIVLSQFKETCMMLM